MKRPTKPFLFILASSSPRRKDLLNLGSIPHQIVISDTKEIVRRNEKPKDLVKRLAYEKALAGAIKFLSKTKKDPNLGDTFFILGADTVVEFKGKILGKPKGKPQAVSTLKKLSGETHQVHTGYSLLLISTDSKCLGYLKEGTLPPKTKKAIRVVSTKVTFRQVNVDEILMYVDEGEPLDKAGSYGAQGKGMGFIESIQGSYTNVIGLPLAEVLSDLRRLSGKKNFL